ncbi:transporter substrate-binding domain-containing protein [Chromobacterium sp. IIBBL 290-4]|uniref:transporter substrate-binding domain-containing protein n=1 Tax=Chromobacterium sp. IIBBL 290-4 TaxID=2953890 RepID=UPI0020B8881C|nr:transporter substrate-binding domain-containing protein [Chromobacterium sp. IIBBL 290-4]UTH76517.1 transporter substrate-binding domain-containing protein [Chromobacterium sp. IIBBL 290-4]
MLLLLLCRPALAQETLRAGVALDSSEPLSQSADASLTQRYREALAMITRQSGIRFQLDYYPSQRLEQLFVVGRLDVEVGVNPSWRALSPVSGFYTQTIGEVSYQLCLPPGGKPRVAGWADLKGKRIGLLAAQRLPQLEPVFQSQRLTADVAGNEEELLDRLRQGRIQAVVLEQSRAGYWARPAMGGRCQPGAMVASLPVMLRVHPQHRDLVPRLNQAIQNLSIQGKFKSLFTDAR